jgi:small conductance mechanosensitive channel
MINKEILMYKMLMPIDNQTSIKNEVNLLINLITNRYYTREGKLRVDLSIGISYGSDMKKAKDVLMAVLEKDEKVMKDPAPFVGVSELGDSSVNLAVRPWSTPDDYWDVYFGVTEKCKNALDEAGISIPFPQMDVHLDK